MDGWVKDEFNFERINSSCASAVTFKHKQFVYKLEVILVL